MNGRLAELLAKYLDQTGSESEMREFFLMVEDPANAGELRHLLGDAFAGQDVVDSLSKEKASQVVGGIVGGEDKTTPAGEGRILPMWVRLAAAACVLVFVSIGIYLNYQTSNIPETATTTANPANIRPGGERALLTLADGRQIELNSAGSGEIATQPGISIKKTGSGQIIYTIHGEKGKEGAKPAINTIATPVGGQYQLILPDGSQVWLNAGSALRYPTFFEGHERVVELTGEAYFEIKPDKKVPFLVKSLNQTVTVLGTHFNVNAYADEPGVKTTLLEGSVKVNAQQLVPGQQSMLTDKGMTVREVDAESEIAWKSGEFVFNGHDLPTIMRMVSRWYNVEISYENLPDDLRYGGEVSRSKNLYDILRMLEATGDVHFKVEGRRVTVIR